MSEQVMNYKCPCCGAPLAYDGASGKLRCASCGNEFEVADAKQADEVLEGTKQAGELKWERASEGEWSGEEAASLRVYSCPSCGAEIVADETTAATQCVYCGNASILPGQLKGDFRPDAILPFRKTKKDAMDAFLRLTKNKRLLPKSFAGKSKAEEIAGVYVPFWMFDCDADADIAYNAERVTTHRSGKYDVTDTDHFLLLRGGSIGFGGVPVDGSSKFDDTLMEAIEPFDYAEEAAFSTAYLPGYQAERYDVDADQARPRADERIRQSVSDAFAETVSGYTSVVARSSNIRLSGGAVRNLLIPVWMLNMKWNKKNYIFAMNGQTGKIVGNLPISKGRAWKWRLGLFFGGTAALTALATALCVMGVM